MTHKPECWKNQARSYLGVGGDLASCTCGLEDEMTHKLKELAEAAAKLSGLTTDEAFEKLIEGIERQPNIIDMTIETVLSMQDEWPMPEWGWKLFCKDIENWARKYQKD